jgi:GntR family transcriptional regulator
LIYTIPGKGSFVADQSERRLRESKQKLVEEKLAEAMKAAKLLGMSRAELREVFNRLLEGEKWDLF